MSGTLVTCSFRLQRTTAVAGADSGASGGLARLEQPAPRIRHQEPPGPEANDGGPANPRRWTRWN